MQLRNFYVLLSLLYVVLCKKCSKCGKHDCECEHDHEHDESKKKK